MPSISFAVCSSPSRPQLEMSPAPTRTGSPDDDAGVAVAAGPDVADDAADGGADVPAGEDVAGGTDATATDGGGAPDEPGDDASVPAAPRNPSASPASTISVPKNAIAASPAVRAGEPAPAGGGGESGSGGPAASVVSFAPGSPSSAIGRKPIRGLGVQSPAASRSARSKPGVVDPAS